MTNVTMCPSVRTLNFNTESTHSWRNPEKIAGLGELSLSWYNTTNTSLIEGEYSATSFDYYTAPTSLLTSIASWAIYLQKPVARKDAAIESCGAGWNCSFIVNFTGPAYKCSDQIVVTDAPFNTSVLIPLGNSSYHVHATLGDYAYPQIASGDSGIPTQHAPYPDHLGAFRTEPLLWVGYSTLKDPDATIPKVDDPAWHTAFEPKIFSCEHRLAVYSVLFNYSSGLQNVTILPDKTYLGLIQETTYVPHVDAKDGTLDNTTAAPVSNYIYPQDIADYRLHAVYHSVGKQLRDLMNGSIVFGDVKNVPITSTEASNSKLINSSTLFPYADLINRTVSLYEDIVLSLLSNPQLVVNTWAANATQLSGSFPGGPDYNCTKTRVRNVFQYHKRDLWLVYSSFILLSIIGIGFGTHAQYQNYGKLRNNRFSNIVGATRSGHLEELDWRAGSWGEMRREIGKTKMKYGIAIDDDGIDHNLGEIFYKVE